MEHDANPSATRGWLKIRVRRVTTATGERTDTTVFCPSQGRTLTLGECTSCSHCTGCIVDSSSNDWLLRCERAVPAPEPALPGELKVMVADDMSLADALRTPVSKVMSSDTHCVREDVRADALTALLFEQNISGVPVVNERGQPVGVISKTDLLRELVSRDEEGAAGPVRVRSSTGAEYEISHGFHHDRLASYTVRELMTPIVFSMAEDAPISRAAALMAYEGVHRLPIVGRAGEVVGLLSSLDVLRWIAQRGGHLAPEWRPR